VDQLLDDLEKVIEDVKQNPPKDGDMVALSPRQWQRRNHDAVADVHVLGLGQTSVGPHVVGKLAETFLDVLYE
jgi:sphinganine-1-phosphate aldolase